MSNTLRDLNTSFKKYIKTSNIKTNLDKDTEFKSNQNRKNTGMFERGVKKAIKISKLTNDVYTKVSLENKLNNLVGKIRDNGIHDMGINILNLQKIEDK